MIFELGSRGFLSPGPHNTPHAGPLQRRASARGVSPRVLEHNQTTECIPELATANTPKLLAPPIGFNAISSTTDSSLLSKVKPFAMSRELPRAFDYYGRSLSRSFFAGLTSAQ